MKHQTASSVTPAGGGANITGSRAPFHLPCDSNSGGGAAVASPPVPDEMPGSAGADEKPNRQVGATLVFGCSSDGTVTIARRSGLSHGYTLTPDEADDLYGFLADTKPIWSAA